MCANSTLDGQRLDNLQVATFALLFGFSPMAVANEVADNAASSSSAVSEQVVEKIESTKVSIANDEKYQREILGQLFGINEKIRKISQQRSQLNQKMLAHESKVRVLAQEVQGLEQKSTGQRDLLNKRLRQLYQTRDLGSFHWLFSSSTPIDLERHHRYLVKMVDSDHKRLKGYLDNLSVLKGKRQQLKQMVAYFMNLQRQVLAQEKELSDQMQQKSKIVAELRKAKDLKLSELKGLRDQHVNIKDLLSLAFFEKRGHLQAPISGRIERDYGAYVDPQFKFRITHKGLFFSASEGLPIRAVAEGTVVVANSVPGYGKTVILDHGDNYYSVYSFAMSLKVREGHRVKEGDPVALSGGGSPLFGPGLYFEIRHFTDAIDPKPWIKESEIKTAQIHSPLIPLEPGE